MKKSFKHGEYGSFEHLLFLTNEAGCLGSLLRKFLIGE